MCAQLSKKDFDIIIRDNLIEDDKKNKALLRLNDPKFDCYYTDAAYNDFLNDMERDFRTAFLDYTNGQGHETAPRRNGPPKMASVASSSRFCYYALRNGAKAVGGGDKIKFEKACEIKKLRTAAQLDAYDEENNIYFEVKCHEIFDGSERFRPSYINFFKNVNTDFGFDAINYYGANAKGEFYIDIYDGKRIDIPRFNVKQFICHLIAISANKEKDTPATLAYLFFKPKHSRYHNEIDVVFEELKSSIKLAFDNDHIRHYCKKHKIKLKAFAEYDTIMQELTNANIEVLY